MKDMWSQYDFDRTIRDYDFTRKAAHEIYKVVYSADFEDMDAETIFSYLNGKKEIVPFHEQLKRYLYISAGITDPFDKVPDEVYADIIRGSFEETYTPHSFEPTTRRWNAIIKGWLTSESVRRESIFLLGFGLKMEEGDVSVFLTKVNKEEDFNRKDPAEVICRYCFRHHLLYARARQLMDWYKDLDDTGGIRPEEEDREVKEILLKLKKELVSDGGDRQAPECCMRLIDRAKAVTANIYNSDEEIGNGKHWEKADIRSSDLEKIICCGIPRTGSGNLEKMAKSQLRGVFDQKRMTRQRLDKLIDGSIKVDRFDLITLLFFIYSQEQSEAEPEIRCKRYIDEVNDLLASCHLSGLYAVNPYEASILMCLLSETPLETYSDIWELSYEGQ